MAGWACGVAERYQEYLDERHQLSVDVPEASCFALVDADRLQQVQENLLDNAAKYSPQGGMIRVVVRLEGEGVLVSVQDQGIGLPADATEAIFGPFGRAPNAAEHQIPGLGLGLHTCRSIVVQHQGRIWAESAGEGQGTSVSFWLPLASEVAPAERA